MGKAETTASYWSDRDAKVYKDQLFDADFVHAVSAWHPPCPLDMTTSDDAADTTSPVM